MTITIVEKDASVLSVGDAQAAEDGGNVVFTVSISAASGEAVTVDYATSDGTATADQDYTSTSGTLTFPANSVTSQTVSVPVTDDTEDEAEEETFTLTLSNVQEASLYGGGSTLAVTGTITDNDDPAVTASFGQTAYSVDEGGTVEVTVTLSADPEREVTILLTHDPQGGASSDDYRGVPESLVFQSDETEKSFTFSATGDDIDDDGESVALAFGALPTRVSAGTTTTVSIDDDDMTGVTISETALSIDEGDSATYTVKLDTEPTGDVTVTVTGASGDVSVDNMTLTFTANNWNTDQTVTVTAGEDEDAASDAAVTLTHSVSGTGEYAGVTAGSVTVTIVEKDASVLSVSNAEAAEDGGNVVFTVSISAASGEEVTVDYATSDGSATAGEDYAETTGTLTFPANSVVSQTVSVPVTDDAVDEEEEEIFTLSNVQVASLFGGGEILAVTGTITDNDDPAVTASFRQASYSVDEGGTVEVKVTLSAEPEREVTVSLTKTDQGGASSHDYSGVPENLVFQSGDTEKSFTFSAAADDIDDDGESVALGFGTPPDGVSAGTTATVSITDDDIRGVTIDPTAFTALAGESYQYTIVLDSEPTGPVTVDISGHSRTDLSVNPTALTFTAGGWDTPKHVTVTVDSTATAASVSLTHTVSGGDYGSVSADDVTVTIVGQPQELVIQIGVTASQQEMTVLEGGSNTYSLVLSSAPTGDVTISVNVPTGNDLSASPASLTFTTSNWNTPRTVTVSAAEDDDAIADDVVTITHATSGGGYADTEVPGIRVTIFENDARGVTIAPTELTIGEGEAGQYTVVLDTLPSETVTVDIGGYSGTDVSVSPAIPLTFTTGNWSQAQTVTVSVGEDEDTSADPAVTLTHSVAGGDYQGQNAAGVTVTITESDQVEPPSVTVSFEKGYHHVADGGCALGVGLLLSAAPESDVTIPIVVLPQSTAGAEDYSGVPNGITFAAGETYTYFWVYPVADTVEEEDEQVWFGLDSLPDGVSAGSNNQTYVTIFDAAHVSFDSSSYSATEGGADAVVTVRLNKPLPNGETIPLTAEGGSGATSDDWSGVPDELYFAAGETEQTFTVTAVDDTVEDDGEMVTLGFGTLSDRLIAVSPATAVITLMNMEEPTTTHGLPACSDSDPLMVGAVYSGNIEAAGQSEWFNFYLEPYKSYIIEIKGVDTGDGTLEDPALLQWRSALSSFHAILPLPSSVTGNRNVERTVWVSIPGVHCFEVASGDNGTGTYKLELRVNENRASGGGPDGYGGHDVPADTSTRITTRWDFEAMYGYLGDDGAAGDDEDWFRIVLTGGVEYQIDLEPLTHDLVREVVDGRRQERRVPIEERHWLNRPRIAGVHDANGAVIQDTASAGQGMEVSVDFTPPADGTYYIAVWSNSDDRTGLFQLCVKEKESSGTNRCIEDAPQQQDSTQQQTELRNSPATGGPGIGGSPRVGKTLTATTEGIADENGLSGAAFTYQWVRHDFGTGTDTDIGGATGASYTVTSDDAGQAIKVRVTFTDDAGHEESLTSYAVAVAATPNSPATGAPTISGTAQVGETLTADTSGISDADGLTSVSYSYQWLAGDSDISGATGSTYTLVDADESKAITVQVSFTDDGGNEETLTCAATEAVAGNKESLTSKDVAAWSATMTVEWVYQGYGYYSTHAKKAGSLSPASFEVDGTTYTVKMVETQGWWMYIGLDRELPFDFVLELDGTRFASNDASFRSYSYGNIYRWEGTGLSLKDGDTVEVRLLRALEDETAVNSAATGAPIVSGTAQVGETLTADTSGIADENGLENVTFTYQWLADNAAIAGATGSTHTLADADEGKAITVQVSFTDDAGNDEMLTSAATAAVSAATHSQQSGYRCASHQRRSAGRQVGETLTADTSGISDADGLTSVSYSYQWLAGDSDISGATNATYTLVAADEGKAIKVRVSFTDDVGNEETLTSAATAVVKAPLTASLENMPDTHDGENAFTFELRFSEEFSLSYKTLRDHAFTVSGGEVEKAERITKGSNLRWLITVRPDGDGQVTITLPATTDCDAEGAICTGDGRMLSNEVVLTVSGPGQ